MGKAITTLIDGFVGSGQLPAPGGRTATEHWEGQSNNLLLLNSPPAGTSKRSTETQELGERVGAVLPLREHLPELCFRHQLL